MEKLTVLREKAAWSKNQNVLNEIGEENGLLTYKGQKVGDGRATDYVDFTIDDESIQLIEDSFGAFGVVMGTFSKTHPKIPVGTEIADIQVRIPDYNEGDWFSLKDMIAFDRTPYVFFPRKVYHSAEYTADIWLHLVLFSIPLTGIGYALTNYGYTSIRIIYYTN